MKQYNKIFFILIISIFLFQMSCDNNYPDSLWPPAYSDYKPRPIINNFDPADTVYSGIGEITIVGENFSSVFDENHVSFNGTEAYILTSTKNEVSILVPPLTDMITPYIDSVMIKMRVDSSELFAQHSSNSSEEYYMTLQSAALEYGGFDDSFTLTTGITCDINENIYASVGATVYVINPDTGRSEFSSIVPITGTRSMKVGPQGYIYFSQLNYLLRIDPDGTFSPSYLILCPNDINDFDFDQNGNMFAADKMGGIHRIDIDNRTITTVANYDSINFKSLRIYNNYVYVAGDYLGSDVNREKVAVWRNEIQSDFSLGLNELFVRWDDYGNAEGSVINSITFSNTGDMYIGPSKGKGFFIYKDGMLQQYYKDVVFSPINTLSWGTGEYLYLIGVNKNEGGSLRVVKIYMGSERSAPYYGRQ